MVGVGESEFRIFQNQTNKHWVIKLARLDVNKTELGSVNKFNLIDFTC